MNADQYYAEPRRTNRLYRDTRRGMIFGVCAGIAEYFAFDLRITRVLTVVGAMFGMPVVFISYLVLGVMLPRKPESDVYDPLSFSRSRHARAAAREIRDVEPVRSR